MEILCDKQDMLYSMTELLHPRMEPSLDMTDEVALASLLSVQPAATASGVLRPGN